MAQQQIKGDTGTVDGDGSLTTYTVPGTSVITPYSVSVTADGSGASGDFLPCLTFRTITGAIIARCPAPGVVAGDSAEVSWFPHVANDDGDIRYDFPNTGSWLDVTATGEAPNGVSVDFDVQGDGGFTVFNEGVGGIAFIDQNTAGITIHSTGGEVSIESGSPTDVLLIKDGGGAGVVIEGDPSDITIDPGSTGHNLFLGSLPTSDPGLSGAVWNSGGTLMISP